MQSYIRLKIQEGEHQLQDFKFEVSDAKKIARSLVAFANTDGGRLLLGVKDNGNIAGVRSDEEVYMIETASTLYCRPEVTYRVVSHSIEGKTVVEIIIEPSEKKPHYAPDKENQWVAYQRVGDENMVANKVMIKVWERLSKPTGVYLKYTDAEQKLLEFLENGQAISISKVCKIAIIPLRKAEAILANFIALGIISQIRSGTSILYMLNTNENSRTKNIQGQQAVLSGLNPNSPK